MQVQNGQNSHNKVESCARPVNCAMVQLPPCIPWPYRRVSPPERSARSHQWPFGSHFCAAADLRGAGSAGRAPWPVAIL